MNDVLKGFAFAAAEMVKLGVDKERRTDLQVGKLSSCKRETAFFYDVVKESAFE